MLWSVSLSITVNHVVQMLRGINQKKIETEKHCTRQKSGVGPTSPTSLDSLSSLRFIISKTKSVMRKGSLKAI